MLLPVEKLTGRQGDGLLTHKDRDIAICQDQRARDAYAKWRQKTGIWHIHAHTNIVGGHETHEKATTK